jgi:hypothetical protein
VILFCGLPPCAVAEEVTEEAVEAEIGRLIAIIKGSQRRDGSWKHSVSSPGFTALNVLALSTAGLRETDPAVRRGIMYLRKNFPSRNAYAVGLYAMAFQSVDAKTYWNEIKRAADWLSQRQAGGTWNYMGTGPGDNSVTQFGMLGIKAAMDARVPVPKTVLTSSEKHFRATQGGDGGWGYRGRGASRPSMGPAGLSSLHVCGVEYEQSLELQKGPAFLGQYEVEPVIERGIKYITKNLEFENAYTAYGIERVGMFFDRRYLGTVDWYREGCKKIIAGRGAKTGHSHAADQFKLLFLAKGNIPLLISKAKWGKGEDWNNRHSDARNVSRFLTRTFQQPLDWQVAQLDKANNELALAPILYISGHKEFELSESEREALQAFISNGGTVLIAPNLQSRIFIRTAIDTIRQIYPGSRFDKLPAHHELRGMYHDLYERDLPLRVLRNGCAEQRVFVFENDFSLDFERPYINKLSGQMAANFARYALKEKPLVGRLRRMRLEDLDEKGDSPDLAEVDGSRDGALALAQIRYEGDFNPDTGGLDNFQGYLRQALSMPTARKSVVIDLADPLLKRYPVLYMSGHGKLPFSGAEKAALRDYLTNGGYLISDACCSRPLYDRSFRLLMKELFPENALEPIPLDKPLYSEPFKVKPAYTPTLERQFKERPEYLWGVRVNDRYVVVYSPGDLGCSMDNHLEDNIPGFKAPSSFQIMTNILSYGLTY